MYLLIGNKLVVWRILVSLVFKAIRFFFIFIQSVFWWANGTAKLVKEARKPKNYESCVQVLNILYSTTFDTVPMCSVDDFICTHNRFESPQYIFDNGNVTLFTVNENDAVFVETEPKGLRIWSRDTSSFIKLAQIEFGTRLLIVPLHAFHLMGKKVGDPKGILLFMFNTSRCGSTLLTQMWECTGQCVSISEPDAANYIAKVYRKHGESQNLRNISRDIIRWICRPSADFQPLVFAIKFTAPVLIAARMLQDIFPRSKCVFGYRHPVAIARSIYKLSYVAPALRVAYIFGRFSPSFTKRFIDSTGYAGMNTNVCIDDDLTLGISIACSAIKIYLDLLHDEFPIAGVLYEDIIANPRYAFSQILKYSGVSQAAIESGVIAFEQDSQCNSTFARCRLARVSKPVISQKSKERANDVMKKYGLSFVGEDPWLPGTITRE